jgi:hypothetical protein
MAAKAAIHLQREPLDGRFRGHDNMGVAGPLPRPRQ